MDPLAAAHPLLVTGASGYLGRRLVALAVQKGHPVFAQIRSAERAPAEWQSSGRITQIVGDLTGDVPGLADAVHAARSVVHCAGAMSGDAATHLRDTQKATQVLLDHLAQVPGDRPWLVLASSIAVLAPPDGTGAMLDEDSDIDPCPGARDSYAAAKIAQEAQVIAASEIFGFGAWVLRIGAVFGPGRLWNAHIGRGFGPVLIRFGTLGQIPLSQVDHAVDALLRAATTKPPRQKGTATLVHVVDDDLPDRRRFLRSVKRSGWPRAVIPVSWKILLPLARLWPVLIRANPPGLMRAAQIRAAFGPARYSNQRLKRLLGWAPDQSFEEAMRAAIDASGGPKA